MKLREGFAYAREHRQLLALWFVVLGPAAAWSVQFLASYNIAETAGCLPGSFGYLRTGGAKPLIAGITTAALLVCVATGLLSIHYWRKLRDRDPTPGGRAHWLSVVGMITSLMFFLLIAGSYAPLAILQPLCSQVQ